MNTIRSLSRGGGLLALLALPGVVAAQSGAGGQLGLGSRIAVRFAVGLVINLVLAGALLAFAPRYARERVADVNDGPGEAFVWGLAVSIGVPVLLVLLAITVIGLVVAIPGVVALAVVGLVGNAVTILWVGDLLTGVRSDPGLTALGIGALVMAVLGSIPVLGNLLVTLAGTLGIGAVGLNLYRSRGDRSRPSGSRRPDRSRARS
ncbi:hypothetical protein BRD00_01635 [Halobacteriales archaeon QS_8_69_26]|nr:MAG: hypothetical protein BRD00_01635 [Halobacteriales archaeon QS_8_69_26]